MSLPNILTLFRFFAALGFALCFVFLPHITAAWAALFIFILASASDLFDGYLARRWGQVSRFGVMLDPIADKALVIVTFMVLAGLYNLDPLVLLPIIIIVLREIFISGLREYVGSQSVVIRVSKLAKYKTTVQFLAVIFLLAEIILNNHLRKLGAGVETCFFSPPLSASEAGFPALNTLNMWAYWVGWTGVAVLWISAGLTVVTGWGYVLCVRTKISERL